MSDVVVTPADVCDWIRTARARTVHRVSRRIVCNDGFSMSVQANQFAYCTPRDDEGPWTEVEVGFPSKIEPLIWEWAEEPGLWTETVYPWVPIEVVAAVVEVHGGLSFGAKHADSGAHLVPKQK